MCNLLTQFINITIIQYLHTHNYGLIILCSKIFSKFVIFTIIPEKQHILMTVTYYCVYCILVVVLCDPRLYMYKRRCRIRRTEEKSYLMDQYFVEPKVGYYLSGDKGGIKFIVLLPNEM